MKTSFRQVMVLVVVLLLVAADAREQDDQASKTQKVDTRIMSQSYWRELAKLGLVEVAPHVPVKDAVYTSSKIDVPGFLVVDSPDVPVIYDPNTTQSENSIFIDPLDAHTTLISNNSTDWDGEDADTFYGADAFVSFNDGQNWQGSVQGAGGTNRGDPAAAIGRNGWFYVGYMTPDSGQGVAHSTNGGNSWIHVQVEDPPDNIILDKNHLWIDNSTSSSYEGNLYSAWTCFDENAVPGPDDGDIMISRSVDSGLVWSTPLNISSALGGGLNQGVNIQTGPTGEVYVAWSRYLGPTDESEIGFARSLDGGVTFEPATTIIENIRGIRITKTSKDMRVNSFPVMSVDVSGGPNSGTIYLVWTNYGVPGINIGPDIDIYMIKSTDSGSTWSAPIRVNQDPIGLGHEHFFPWITCDPVSGALSVIFYDDRNVGSTDCEVFVACSEGAGERWTWVDFKVSDVSFTPSPIPQCAIGYFGDYLGISARDGIVYPAWTDNRDGRAMAYVSPFTYSFYPRLVSTSPLQNEANVPASTYVSVAFNADMDSVTINDSTLVVNARTTGRHEGMIVYDSPTRTATLYPFEAFGEGEVVTVTVTNDIESSDGDPLEDSHVWSFTIASDDGSGTFAPDSAYAVGNGPESVFAADFDGDGDVDIVTANAPLDSVSVLLNNGDGTFGPDLLYEVGDEPFRVCAADLDGDGDSDIATANRGSADVSVLLNNGDGTFGTNSLYEVGDVPMSIFAADLDGDGDLDLSTANMESDDISILLNYGNGIFAPDYVYPVGEDPYSVFAADLDGDGDLDLAVTDMYPANFDVSVLFNNGNGVFSLDSVYAVGDAPSVVFAADLDNDRDLDLAVALEYTDEVAVLWNNGDGRFAPYSVYPVGLWPVSVFAADLDGDGALDLAAADYYTNNVSVVRNYGDGTFAPYSAYPVGNGPTSIFAADLDGDGDLDLTAANLDSDNISVLLNYHAVQIVHTAPTQNEIGVPVGSDILVEFDIDMDATTFNDTTFVVNARSTGRHEGAIFYDSPTRTAVLDPIEDFGTGEVVTVVLTTGITSSEGDPLGKSYAWSFTTAVNDGVATFVPDSVYLVGGGPVSVFAADIDDDGDLDLTTAIAADSVALLLNNGDGTFTSDSVYPVGDGPNSVFTADLDGDGDLDLTTANAISCDVSVLLNNGDGTFAPDSVYPVGDDPRSICAADLDGDGDIDLTTVNRNSDDISILSNNGDGTFVPDSVYPVGDYPGSIVAADLDGDGTPDLTTTNGGSDNVSLLISNGDGTFAPDSIQLEGSGPTSVFAADLDGDGDLDLATANAGSDNVSILLNNGDGTFAPDFVCSLPDYADPFSIFAADFDGDGDLDLATANFVTSNISILLNSGYGTFESHSEYALDDGSLFPLSIFAADLDGDGDVDLTTANVVSNNVSVLLNAVVIACEVTPASLDFGSIFVDDARDLTFTIRNVGSGPLTGTVNESCDHYSIVSGGGAYSLAVDESLLVTVRFEADSTGTHNCTVETGNHCTDVSCSGVAMASSGEDIYVRTLGGSYFDHGGTIVQTSDGGFVVGGGTESLGEGDCDNLLAKFDFYGNHLWTRAVGYGGNEGGIGCVVEVSGGGLVVFGWSESFWADREHLIAKFDGSGNHLWSRTIRGVEDYWSYGGPVIETSDKGLVAFGSTNSFTYEFDLFLSKFDSTGTHSWTKTLLGSDTERPGGLLETSDGGLVVTGCTVSYGVGDYDVILAKFDSAGNLLWVKTVGGAAADWGYSVALTYDGGFVVTGYTASFGAGGKDVLLSKFDASGNHLWSRTLGGDAEDLGASVVQASDGGLVVAGHTASFGTGDRDVLLAKFSASGNHLWSRTLGESGEDRGHSVVQAIDGRLIMTGRTGSFGADSLDLLLASFNGGGSTCSGRYVIPKINAITPDTTTPSPTVTSQSPTITEPVPTVASPAPDITVVCASPVTAVDDGEVTTPITETMLFQNRPNPCNATTVIPFTLREDGRVVLEIFDVSGRHVRTLVDRRMSAGRYSEFWDGKNTAGNQVASGVFFYRLRVGGKAFTRKCVLVK